MKKYIYYPQGTCSVKMTFVLDDDNRIEDFAVERGCNGNLKGIRSLILNQKAEDIIAKLEGITCHNKPTSCPDQIAKGLRKCLDGSLKAEEE